MATPGYNTGGNNISGQLGMPLYGVASFLPFTGNYFWVDQTNGSDGNTGGPSDAFATLSQALSKCVSGNNDVIFLTGTVNISSTLTWSKNKTHLIGLAPNLSSQARARISQTGSTVFSPLVNVTATECIFRDIGSFHGFADASTQICWKDEGGRNEYTRCLFGGMGNATAAAQTGSRSLLISGTTGENTFTNCQIGIDTITRSAANASLEFVSGTPRNVFRNCTFPLLTSSASAVIATAGAAGMDRFALFDNCSFLNAIASTSTTASAAFTLNASAGGLALVQGGSAIGFTKISASGPVYVNGAVPTGATSSIAVAAA